jgi:glycolate dehydrogenase FAD-binding subunit
MAPTTIAEIKDILRSHPRVSARGGGSKPGLAYPEEDATPVDLSGLRGLLEYRPEEFTFTARAGTPLREVLPALAQHGQSLPFDPPLSGSGATLGGTVASGLSGPGRYRYGGVRDFLLGVEFLNGEGELVRSGGKVVKNAAGFDLSKLMVGSLGQYGLLVELSFKVFPSPKAYATVTSYYPALKTAMDDLVCLTQEPLELFALELEPRPKEYVLSARVGGEPATLSMRIERLRRLLHSEQVQVVEGETEAKIWDTEREFGWVPSGNCLVKVPLTPERVALLEEQLSTKNAMRHYSAGANLAWIAWPGMLAELGEILQILDLTGLVVLGPGGQPILGVRSSGEFAKRVKAALDPQGKFVSLGT